MELISYREKGYDDGAYVTLHLRMSSGEPVQIMLSEDDGHVQITFQRPDPQ